MKSTICSLLAVLVVGFQLLPSALGQNSVYVTGKLDGYATDENQAVFDPFFDVTESRVLLGMGDNLALDYYSTHENGIAVSRTDFKNAPPAANYLRSKHYTAMVPGVRDFHFGAAMLYRLGNRALSQPSVLPLLGSNMVVCRSQQQAPTGPAPQVQIMLPTEGSLPTAVATPGGSSSGGGSGGGGGGKGKSSGGSGSSGAGGPGGGSSSSPSAQGASAQAQTVGCNASQGGGGARTGSPIQLVYPAPSQIYPWTTRLVFTNPYGLKDIQMINCPVAASAGRCPVTSRSADSTTTVDLQNIVEVCPNGDIGDTSSGDCELNDPPPGNKQTNPGRLYPGSQVTLQFTYKLAGSNNSDPSYEESVSLQVQIPFFSSVWKCNKDGKKDCSVNAAEGQNVAFAVVSPSLEGEIPLTDRQLCETGKPCATSKDAAHVAFNEGTSALIQATLAYEKLNHRGMPPDEKEPYNPNDRDTYFVMAQMAPDEAVAFARSLSYRYANYRNLNWQAHPWDVVISAADAYAYTRAESQTLGSADPADLADSRIIPVITPRPLLLPKVLSAGSFNVSQDHPALKLKDPVSQVTLTRNHSGDPQGVATLSYTPGLVDSTETCDSLDQYLAAGKQPPGVMLPKNWLGVKNSSDVETSILQSMANNLQTDIAMLQHHDVYLGCALNLAANPPKSFQELVKRLLPETGYLTRVSITGATLQTLLQVNDSILAQSPTATQPIAAEQSRALALYGITRGVTLKKPGHSSKGVSPKLPLGLIQPESTYYINGAPLDPTKTYSIATSEHLATAEPIFPQLAQQDLESPTTFFWPKENAKLIADVVGGTKTPTPKMVEVVGTVTLPAASKDQMKKGFVEQLATGFKNAWFAPFDELKTSRHAPLPKSLYANARLGQKEQYQWQNRGYWDVTMQQLSASWAYTHPNLSDTGIGNDFSGVTNPNVISAHSDSVSAASNARVLHPWERQFAFGADEIVAYSRSHTGSTTPSAPGELSSGAPVPPGPTIVAANTVIASPFFAIATFRSQPHWIPMVFRGLFNHDLSSTEQFLKSGWSIPCSSANCTSPTEPVYFTLRTKPQWGWAPAVGTRYELSNLSYVEVGYLRQYSMNILDGIGVDSSSGATVLPLQNLAANESAASVVSAKVCSATVTEPCLNNPSTGAHLTYRYNQVHQNGAYVLGFWNANLFNLRQITSQTVVFGNIYESGNPATRSSTETKYAANMSESLNFNVFANISLGPQYSVFAFKDESTVHPNSLSRQQLSIQLNYTFDWHTGLPLRTLVGKAN